MAPDIIVSISCIVFNHAPYLRETLDGFLHQKTNFRYEVLIHDDCSTDGSQEIIKEYEHKYHDIIYPIYEKENQYSKGVPIGSAVWNFPRARGRYIAICEGDDYWTDPMKLQKQVDYMEAHPDCALCVHNAIEHWENAEKEDSLFSDLKEQDYTGLEITENWILPTASFLCRSDGVQYFCDLSRRFPRMSFSDTVLAVSCSNVGHIHALPDVMSVYRRSIGSFTLTHSAQKHYATARSWDVFAKMFGDEYKNLAVNQAVYNDIIGAFYSLKERKIGLFLSSLKHSLLLHPAVSLRKVVRLIKEKSQKA